jgi:pyruvate carboxylase
MDRPTPRAIRRLLVANRGEIATRIISSARELNIETFAVYTNDDLSHTLGAAHSIKLSSPASYLNIQELVSVAKEHGIDAVHPGYGFLSESAKFAAEMWDVGIAVVGPGWGILKRTGDKLKARLLAEECCVPVLPALRDATNDIGHLRQFAADVGYPIMTKAVDGGGGRGIRLISSDEQLESNAKRAIEESPSKMVFAEKAAVDGYLHVEVQIVGDGSGDVQHLWERQCSIQRRYQKVVEIAPCLTPERKFIAQIIESAVRMAKQVRSIVSHASNLRISAKCSNQVNYFSLGTFEFLANPSTQDFFFLEINPRLQVEHTITEAICSLDIVRIQLLLSQGASLAEVGLRTVQRDPVSPPRKFSSQFRITAENVHNDYSLSIGKISSFQFPSGNGVRVDTNLVNGHQAVVGSDFDSLLAKLVITAPTWEQVVSKAKRALQDTKIVGVKTNLDILRGIVAHPDFAERDCDTRWLEANHKDMLQLGERFEKEIPKSILPEAQGMASFSSSASSTLFRKGDAWTITLKDAKIKNATPIDHHMQISKVLRNEFPAQLAADILYTTPGSREATSYTLTLQSTTSSAAAATAQHRKGNPADPTHVVIPFPGTLIEVMVDVGDVVREGDVICVVRQMKMELEVRAPRAGTVTWLLEVEEGEEVTEGVLAAEIGFERGPNAKL